MPVPVEHSMEKGKTNLEQHASTPDNPEKKPTCKPCCACPETKRVRDACIVENGEENCTKLIEAHRECMKEMGFNI